MSEQKITITIRSENMNGNGKFLTNATISESTLNEIMALLIKGSKQAVNIPPKIGSLMK